MQRDVASGRGWHDICLRTGGAECHGRAFRLVDRAAHRGLGGRPRSGGPPGDARAGQVARQRAPDGGTLVSAGPAILSDLRFAIKSLCRSPGFTLIAVITLGLGIGANTSMFSILNEYMLRPAPYPDRDKLDRIYRTTPQDPRGGISPADYLDLKSEVNGYGEIAAYAASDMSLSQPGKPAETA